MTVSSFVNPIKYQCFPYIETSQLICCANQLTGFYMRATLALNSLNTVLQISKVHGCSNPRKNPFEMFLQKLLLVKKSWRKWNLRKA